MNLEFRPRADKTTKYQARFWTTEPQWRRFAVRAENDGLFIQDVLNQFMEWFVNRPMEEKKDTLQNGD